MSIKVGAVVRLKSGSHAMTVKMISTEDNEALCQWFDDKKQLTEGWFAVDGLKEQDVD